MGYTTYFTGTFQLNKPATQEQIDYINTFSETRRMKRDPNVLLRKFNGKHGLNGDYGTDGQFFALDDGNFGQTKDESIVDYNNPPAINLGYGVNGFYPRTEPS